MRSLCELPRQFDLLPKNLARRFEDNGCDVEHLAKLLRDGLGRKRDQLDLAAGDLFHGAKQFDRVTREAAHLVMHQNAAVDADA